MPIPRFEIGNFDSRSNPSRTPS
eukprot:gene27083-biopygen17641